jgi:hypothetical protein
VCEKRAEVEYLREGLCALLAFVRAVSRVDSDVPSQVRFLFKHLCAVWTKMLDARTVVWSRIEGDKLECGGC